jgi:NAD(P)H-hydrate epimerase
MTSPEPAVTRFVTDSGIEVPAVTADEMRELDRIAVEETGPNLFQMMENAGRDLALLAIEVLGSGWQTAKIVVLAGRGGNGGGGICAARHLANRRAKVVLVQPDADHLGGVPAFQRKIFRETHGQEVPAARVAEETADLVLDALIGYGLRDAPRGTAADLIRWANGTGAPILALDVPSGVDSTTGETPGDAIRPRWTMTVALPKTGLLRAGTGDLFLADIGIPEGAYRRVARTYTPPFGGRYRVPLARR